MHLQALKAQWSVIGGVILGVPEQELTKVWSYTSVHYEEDERSAADRRDAVNADEIPPPTVFMRMMDEAHTYARSLTNPARVNWVTVSFMWV